MNRFRQNQSAAIWSRALKKGIVYVPRAETTHIHPGVKPIVQRKRDPLAAVKRAPRNISTWTTHYCPLRGVILGADFNGCESWIRDALAL